MGAKHYNIRLKLRGVMRDAQSRCDTVELQTTGRMIFEDDGTIKVLYEEQEDSGLGQSITQLRIKDGCVDMSREGDTIVSMHFEKGKQYLSQYRMEQGMLNVSIFTNRVLYKLDDRGGKIRLAYVISIENGPSSENSLSIDIAVN